MLKPKYEDMVHALNKVFGANWEESYTGQVTVWCERICCSFDAEGFLSDPEQVVKETVERVVGELLRKAKELKGKANEAFL